MLKDNKVLIVIPALNEGLSIASTLVDVLKFFPKSSVLVIDDGSTDSTLDIAQEFGVKTISLAFNCGIGAVLRLGLKYGILNNFDHIVIFDGDGQHSAIDINKLLTKSDDKNIVVGVRSYENYKFGFIRKVAHLILRRLLQYKVNLDCTDPTSGFRVFSKHAAVKVSTFIGNSYLEDTVLLLIVAKKLSIQVCEVSVEVDRRKYGKPSTSGLSLILRFIIIVLMLLLRKDRE